MPATSRASFELAYRDVGIRLRIPGITDDNADIKQLVKKELDSGRLGDWLMIVDNADDASVLLSGFDGEPRSSRLSDYLPHSDSGKIIFTTRSKKAAESLTQSNVIKLDDMDRTEARQLMAQRLSKKALLEDEEAVDELLRLLAHLPLAIVQAAAFINSNETSISEYVSLLRQPSMEIQLLSEHFEDPSRYPEIESTIAKTWHISFNQILKQDRLAAKYLSFMACIDRINIPLSLLPPAGSPLEQAKAVGTLKAYAFIAERQQVPDQLQEERFFNIHRLVHMASIWWLKEHGEWTTWMGKAAARLEELVPYGGHERKDAWTAYLSHAIHLVAVNNTPKEIARASLLGRVGRCQATLGQYSAAETTLRQALSLREKILGTKHRHTLTSMNNVGVALSMQGRYGEADAMHRQTLAMQDEVLGKEHPGTLTSMGNLARVLSDQGKYEESEAMDRQTLAMREKVHGKAHPSTLTSFNNLAVVLYRQGKYEAAEAMHRQKQVVLERVLGKEHPDTLMNMSNLALVLNSQGKYEAATLMHRQALVMREKVLGKDHPDTLTSLNNLALACCNQRKDEAAEAMLRQALAGSEKVLGKEHPDTLGCMNNLAGVLGKEGKYEEAEAMLIEALAMLEKVLGKEHPHAVKHAQFGWSTGRAR